jgi:F1F0 ATPase subunit 2
MTTHDLLSLPLVFGAGVVLGLFYFGGLWLTVRQIPLAGRPGLLSFVSFVVRTAATLLGFYVVMGGRWERLLIALAGFLAFRTVAVRRWGPGRLLSSSEKSKGGSLAD